MAGGVGEERRNGGGSGRLKRRRPAEPRELDMLFSRYVLLRTYLLKAVTGFGYLALTWSTVVLLGGFVTSLQEQDFWCITVISMMQAARIFSDLADQLLPKFFNLVTRLIRHNRDVLRYEMWRAASSTLAQVTILLYGGLLMLFLGICYVPSLLYMHGGAIACIALAMWRIAQRDYGADPHDNSKANLTPALDMFYSLILLQGVLYLIWLHVDSSSVDHLVSLRCLCRLPNTEWCRLALVEYLVDTRARCWRDLSSIRGRRLVDYAVDLLDSRSWEDNLSGVRMLDAFIRQGTADVRSLLLSSRSKVQKLIDTLGCRHGPQAGGSREMRELAGHVLAHLTGDIHLAHFPGAIQCISSLLQDETTTTTACYWDGSQQQERPRPQQTKLASQRQAILLRLEKREQRHVKREQRLEKREQLGGASDNNIAGGCHGSELIVQGLAILESLALDHHNCRDICATPGLVPKIMAPICSSTLIQDFGSSGEWESIVNGSFRVLHRLTSATGETSRTLRLEIASNKQAVRNLEMILDQGNGANQELKIQAMKILTELALDSSIKIPDKTKEKFIKKQLQIFLTNEAEQEPTSLTNPLKLTAGRTLVLTSTNSQTNSDFIMRAYHGNLLDSLTGLLDSKKNIMYRTIAAEILENFCTHCDWNKHKQIVIESLLPKVFTQILSIKSDRPEIKISDEKENKPQAKRWTFFKKRHNRGNEENLKNSAPGKDEENPQNIALRTNEQNQGCAPGDRNMIQEISSSGDQKKSSDPQNEEQTASTKELQEALLSLAQAICGKLINAGDAVQVNVGGDIFVAKLKTIIDDNFKPTADSLRIVKLCGSIAASMMQCQAYAELFRNKEFVQSLSKASKIMYSLESCMMFAGTDFRLKKTIRPLLSKIVSELEQKARQSV
ncbi:unnamed protein product [Urochloa decumbens]|uniref:Uncharacterized protein n=1 Tax=Urochloa decumbens TaxID=240449 RepID=A0ABC9B4R8_9POAL